MNFLKVIVVSSLLLGASLNAAEKKEETTPRKCTVTTASSAGCHGKEVMSRCTEKGNPGVCTPEVWHEESADCVCANFPAQELEGFARKVIKNVKDSAK